MIPQAHPTGYPIYRLEWQGLGSLQRRLRNCMTGVRAEPFAYGAQEMVELELYLAARARGMASEAPPVRPWALWRPPADTAHQARASRNTSGHFTRGKLQTNVTG